MLVFRFAKQRIVDLKSNEKKQSSWMLSRAIHDMKGTEKSLEQLNAMKDSKLNELDEMKTKGTSISDILLEQQYVEYIDQKIVVGKKELHQSKLHVQQRQQDLSYKTKDEKIWNKSKQRAHELFKEEVNHKEQSELDEIASTRYSMS
ncbi:flagellar export protein FliJ [Longirhabdus pacifica]|uniref:flagellar export protein FliJ n=1 Tax=Longirhabdus pacifica TaxID=2305227 RepID=UPI001008C7C3|nr:flagellar FliJ family protein [Longirhabdus pacifica]